MLFSNVLSLAVAVSSLLSVVLAQAPLTPGRYRIWNGPQFVCSFPNVPKPPFDSRIIMCDLSTGIWSDWGLTSDGGDGFYIQNYGTSGMAYAAPTMGTQVIAASNERSSWLIQGGGQTSTLENLYTVKLSAGDFLWTNTAPTGSGDNTVTLQGSDGSSSQRFVFQKI